MYNQKRNAEVSILGEKKLTAKIMIYVKWISLFVSKKLMQ